MYRLCSLLMSLAFSFPACAGESELLPPLSFNPEGGALTSSAVSMDDTVVPVAWAGEDLVPRSRQARERHSISREKIFEALGLSRYLPSGQFTAFGQDGRWSLSLHEDESVTLRLRVKW